jgi:hypothetical protein
MYKYSSETQNNQAENPEIRSKSQQTQTNYTGDNTAIAFLLGLDSNLSVAEPDSNSSARSETDREKPIAWWLEEDQENQAEEGELNAPEPPSKSSSKSSQTASNAAIAYWLAMDQHLSASTPGSDANL